MKARFGAVVVAGMSLAGLFGSSAVAVADDAPSAVSGAPAASAAAPSVGDGLRSLMEFNRKRPLQKYPSPVVRYVQVLGDPIFNRRLVDGVENQFAVALYDSQAGQEYRKAFGMAADDDGAEGFCGGPGGCDGYVKGILNTPLPVPRVSAADRVNVVGFAQRTGGCKGLPTGALQRCQSARK
ncbi:hypothetical protein I5G97_gp019 [Mycobacterium phage Curiosium]|uniref:Uncharacterized protein n=1 Tax=Mycobacterium phage Curiosium TaxID=2599859 RepID=A0A5J6TVQ4_9CAUD|nr:hypothetical protein I5G97_gp019 [Mycobacterium phage Curiosium]QFG14134.1 hypothetical protein PBI_CURIOSIUM_91 [Mycobacterium phage Curiosium]